MRLVFLAVVIGCSGIAAAIVACGNDSDVNPVVQQVDDAGVDVGVDTGEPVEEAATTFPCGEGNTCNVGQHACCQLGALFACVPAAGGCPASDAGADSEAGPPPLLCLTYLNCTDGGQTNECCYRQDAGSFCMSNCPSGFENLCRRGIDGCGQDDCDPFNNPPMAGIGSCQ